MEKCYNDFMEVLAKNPDKLSKIKDDDINMICTYLQSNPAKALEDYPKIKGVWN